MNTLFTTGRPEATAGKGKTRAHSTAADGTLTKPIKIEDSEGDDLMSDAVLNHLDELADEMVQSPLDPPSPSPLQQAAGHSTRLEVEDDEMEF